jgi:hypothetical protein
MTTSRFPHSRSDASHSAINASRIDRRRHRRGGANLALLLDRNARTACAESRGEQPEHVARCH